MESEKCCCEHAACDKDAGPLHAETASSPHYDRAQIDLTEASSDGESWRAAEVASIAGCVFTSSCLTAKREVEDEPSTSTFPALQLVCNACCQFWTNALYSHLYSTRFIEVTLRKHGTSIGSWVARQNDMPPVIINTVLQLPLQLTGHFLRKLRFLPRASAAHHTFPVAGLDEGRAHAILYALRQAALNAQV